MEFDVFFSICQVAVDGYKPSERVMMENFFEQVRAADRLGCGTAWLAESHLSSVSQKKNPGAVIPHFDGEIGLNVDFLQLAQRILASTGRLSVGSAVMNILCNGGPIAAAERVRAFLLLHSLQPHERRRLEVGFAQGRFPYINAPYGIVPRNPVEAAGWDVLKNKIFTEATEIFLRLLRGDELSAGEIGAARKTFQRADFRKPAEWDAVLAAYGKPAESIDIAPWWSFPTLKIIPQEAPLELLNLVIGSHDPETQVFANTFMPVGVFNLSITSRDVVESTHQRMQKAYNTSRGPWTRSHMPRTTLVFINGDPGVSGTERNARARAHARQALAAYWTALEGTLDPRKVESASDNALIGDPDAIEAQMRERFDPGDRLMLWFDFFNHDSRQVVRDMELFMREVAPRFSPQPR